MQVVHGLPESTQQPDDIVTSIVWTELLADVRSPAVLVNRSHFTPGARTCWHVHPGGQVLIIESGVALVQERNGPVTAVRAGQSVVCHPGVDHWHGAAPRTTMTQLAITLSSEGEHYAQWGPLVSDEEYGAWDVSRTW